MQSRGRGRGGSFGGDGPGGTRIQAPLAEPPKPFPPRDPAGIEPLNITDALNTRIDTSLELRKQAQKSVYFLRSKAVRAKGIVIVSHFERSDTFVEDAVTFAYRLAGIGRARAMLPKEISIRNTSKSAGMTEKKSKKRPSVQPKHMEELAAREEKYRQAKRSKLEDVDEEKSEAGSNIDEEEEQEEEDGEDDYEINQLDENVGGFGTDDDAENGGDEDYM